jgi:hypothetical protein
MTTATPKRALPWLLQSPEVRDFHAPRWFDRLPRWVSIGGVLLILVAISVVIRTRYIDGQFWSDEATAVGVASHPLGQIPGLLRQQGSTPLYYFVLHIWISLFGFTESATHALSLLFGIAAIPLAMWAGWSLAGRRAGIYSATLFAFSAFFTQYAQETQAWELLGLIGLIATATFVHAFVYRRRWYLIAFAASLALLLYTSFWGIFFWAGVAVAVIVIHRASEDRRGLLRDAAIAFGAAVVIFAPWIPNLVYQMSHTTSPWGYVGLAGATFPSNQFGSDRIVVAFAVSGAIGVLPLLARSRRRTPEAVTIWALLAIPFAAALVARIASVLALTWVARYFAPLVAPLLLVAAFTSARAGILGLIAVLLSLAFVAHLASFSPQYKSDMRDVAGELSPYMRPADLVIVGDPEQVPLAWYYLPGGLRFATLTGSVSHPSNTNWINAYARLRSTDPRATLDSLVASLAPGQRLLFTRPLSEGEKAWTTPWARLVRRRAAQWGALISTNRQLRRVAGAVAPHNYRGSCCVADSAVVYAKVG